MRARGGLWVVLDGKDRQPLVTESLNRPIVQVEVGNLEFGSPRDGLGVGRVARDCKAVVL